MSTLLRYRLCLVLVEIPAAIVTHWREILISLEDQYTEHRTLKRAGHITPWVFVRQVAKGRRGPKMPKRVLSIRKAWKAACQAAGLPGRIPHDFRRSAARNMVRAGVPERVAMQLTGHKTRSVFERYNIVSDGDLAHAAIRLSGQLTGRRRTVESES